MQTARKNHMDIKQMLLRISTYSDTVQILDLINRELIINSDDGELRSMRQKVYDTRRRLKLVPDAIPQAESQKAEHIQTAEKRTYAISYANMSLIGAYAFFALCSGALIFIQSLEIYSRATFDHPILATSGALLLVCAASIIRALKPNKLTLLLCIYALSYESYLMISGTMEAQNVIAQSSVSSDPRMQLAQLESDTALEAYEKVKSTYESNHNGWYKIKYLEPAKAKYMASLEKIASVKSPASESNFSLLKILYRIGLLFLFSLSVSFLISRINNK